MMNEYSDFKPVDRSRAYTWHGSHSGVDGGHSTASKFAVTVQTYGEDSGSSSVSPSSKKPWSRRNAWGSMSYADLIGKAIESTVDKRMTLSQIYDWMIQNIPYFHDKGSGNSSTGWKNSIRHNLSLHRRFKRVPNEDSGKSSWWMLNDTPDQSLPTRKRTVSVGKFEGKEVSADLAPPSAKISHVAPEPVTTTSQNAGSRSTHQLWLQTVQPRSSYDGVTTHLPDWHQTQWHQPSTETNQLFSSDFAAAFARPSYMPTSCTPLAPISELLSPQQFTPYDLQAVEVPSPPSFVTIQTVSGEPTSFAEPSLATLSSVTMLDASSQPSVETYAEAGPASTEPPSVESSLASCPKGLTVQSPQWTPGWSMLRQMLSQSHRENALMHGVVSDNQLNPLSSAEYLHSGDGHQLQPATTSAVQFGSSTVGDHGFSYITSPQSVDVSDVVYVQMTADTDDSSVIQQPVPTVVSDTEGNTQLQSVHTDYADVPTTVDENICKTADADNNNESVVAEKSV